MNKDNFTKIVKLEGHMMYRITKKCGRCGKHFSYTFHLNYFNTSFGRNVLYCHLCRKKKNMDDYKLEPEYDEDDISGNVNENERVI